MSRSGMVEGDDPWDWIRWRGIVTNAIKGQRGQRLLRDLLVALDSMPCRHLVAHEFVTEQGEMCALGCVALARGVRLGDIDPEDECHHSVLADRLDVPRILVREIEDANDTTPFNCTPEDRWQHMREWVVSRITRKDTAQ
jgi:hypothetical protein